MPSNYKVEISVVMSVYNGGAYLAKAIDSILQQSFADFEFIILNDGSTDDTEKIILSYKDNRIVYIDIGFNVGLVESLNRGLQYSKGNYIARMDADDIAMKHRFKYQVEAFRKNPNTVAVGTDYYAFNDQGTKRNRNINDSDYLKTLLLFGPSFCHPTTMIKNIFKAKKLQYDRKYVHVEDYELWTDLVSFGDFANINMPLLKYRSHDNQISHVKRMEQLRKCADIRKQYLNHLGFKFTEEQFKTHNFISDNYFIDSKQELAAIEAWLFYLIKQNHLLNVYNKQSFNKCINKMWLDSCGNSNLGLYAFKAYFQSKISKLFQVGFGSHYKLLLKCIIRYFKK
jgi:glycosyltransferase involved in cell wall biosynthesis